MTAWICVLLMSAAAPEGSTAPPSPTSSAAGSNVAVESPASSSVAESGRPPKKLRADIHGTLRAAATETGPARDAAIRHLSALYVELSRDTQLTLDERLTLGRTIRSRLLKIKDQIARGRGRSLRGASELDSRVELTSSSKPAASTSKNTSAANALGGLAGPPDDGENLLELIQQTIAPSTWDINGGLGTIYYYRPLHAIVVRQTGEGHDLVGGVINALRE